MKHLKIEQSTSSIEVVDPKVIDKLYNLVLFHPVGESLDSTSNLKGNLLCSHAYGDVVDYLTTNYKDLSISVTGGIYIRFEDKNVETICATNFGDGTGLTSVLASVVNTLNGKFPNNTVITKFNELKNFINYTVLEGWAFLNCTNLTLIDLSNIITLGVQSFNGCSSLASINLSSKCINENNCYGTFLNCTSLVDVGDVSGFPIVLNSTFTGCTNLVSVNLSNKCTKISLNAFKNCSKITTVGDISAVTTLDASSFENCQALTSVGTIPLLTSIGDHAFKQCYAMQAFTCGTTLSTVNDYAFENCTALGQVVGFSNLTALANGIFKNCTNLQSVDTTDKVTTIGNEVFIGCSKLASIGNVNNVISIGRDAFAGCSMITSLHLGEGLTTLGYEAFARSGLTSIIIPSTVTTMGGSELSDTSTPQWAIVLPTSPVNGVNKYSFKNGGTYPIFVPDGSLSTYKSTTEWSNYTDRLFKLSDFFTHMNITTIQPQFLAGRPTVTLMDCTNVSSVGESAFKNCTGLTAVGLTSACVIIDDDAFNGCTNLQQTGALTNVTSIGEGAFYNCTSLTSVGDLSNCTYISLNAFANCTSLTSVGDLSNCTILADAAFSGCTALLRVILGSHIVSIGNLCFLNCTALDFIHIDSTACPALSSYAFDGAKSTFKIYVPDAQVSAYKAASVWSTFADKIYSFTQLDTDFPGTR